LPLSLLALAACGSRQLRTIDPPSADASGPSMAVDPMGELPRASDMATPNEYAVTLRAPVSTELVSALVRRLFESFHARSTAAIDADLDDDIVELRFDGGEVTVKKWSWTYNQSTRIKNSPFDQLDIDQMYRPQDVEIYARDELGLPGRPSRPKSMEADDLLVRIPIATTRVGADVLFGDEIRLLLRREGSRYKIHGYGEVVPK
jgi:hypothetical protein